MTRAPLEEHTDTITVTCRESAVTPWDGPEAGFVGCATLADLEGLTARLRELGCPDDFPVPLPGPLSVTVNRA